MVSKWRATDGIVIFYTICVILLHKCFGNFRCLSCMEIARPRYCEYIQTCGDHEECYVDSYATVSGTVRYNLGCRDKQMCMLTSMSSRSYPLSTRFLTQRIPICNECCEGDLCNQKGCGQNGFPSTLGPLCFNCQQQLHPNDCDKVMLCGQAEVCKINTREIAGDTIYSTGCESELVCARDFDQIVGRRNTPCTNCCNTTLCNNSCVPSPVKCEDKLRSSCYKHGNEICRSNSPFYAWARENCIEKCGWCRLSCKH